MAVRRGWNITEPRSRIPATTTTGALQAGLDQAKLRMDMLNSARYLKAHQLSTGKLGVNDFCWGGSTTSYLAETLGADMHAGVPFCGAAAETSGVPSMKAPLLIHYAENLALA